MPSPHVTRTKSIDVVPLQDDRYAFTARLTDVSAGGDYGQDAASSVIHDFALEGELTGPRLRVAAIRARADTYPYPTCPFVLETVQDLVGGELMSGWRRAVLARTTGTRGCTHITTLLLGLAEIQTMVFFLRMNRHVPFNDETRHDGRWTGEGLRTTPSLLDACYSLRRDGEVIRGTRPKPE